MSSVDSEINRSWGSGFGVRLLDRLDARSLREAVEAAMPPGAPIRPSIRPYQ